MPFSRPTFINLAQNLEKNPDSMYVCGIKKDWLIPVFMRRAITLLNSDNRDMGFAPST